MKSTRKENKAESIKFSSSVRTPEEAKASRSNNKMRCPFLREINFGISF